VRAQAREQERYQYVHEVEIQENSAPSLRAPSMSYREGNIVGITTQQLHSHYTLEMRLLDEPEGSHF